MDDETVPGSPFTRSRSGRRAEPASCQVPTEETDSMEALRMALVVAQGDGEDEEIEPSMQEALQAALDE